MGVTPKVVNFSLIGWVICISNIFESAQVFKVLGGNFSFTPVSAVLILSRIANLIK